MWSLTGHLTENPREAPRRSSLGLGQVLWLAVGNQGSSPGWTMVDDVRVRHGLGHLVGKQLLQDERSLGFP